MRIFLISWLDATAALLNANLMNGLSQLLWVQSGDHGQSGVPGIERRGTMRGLPYRGAMHELVKPKPLHEIVRVTQEDVAHRHVLQKPRLGIVVSHDTSSSWRHSTSTGLFEPCARTWRCWYL